MSINKQIKNIIYTQKRIDINAGCNILYNSCDNFFDVAINELSSNTMVSWNINQLSGYWIDYVLYSALWINDPIDFSQRMPEYASFFSKYIMCIHSPPSPLFKKEDLSIIKNKLNSCYFLSFYQDRSAWPMDNIKYINYGVPNTQNISTEKEKDIILINTKKQKQTNILYQYLKNDFPQTEIIESCSINMDDIIKTISRYKICIDIDSYFNVVLANACGTYGITSLESFDAGIHSTKNYSDIMKIIPSLLSQKQESYDNIKREAIAKYDWNTFENNVNIHLKEILLKDFPI